MTADLSGAMAHGVAGFFRDGYARRLVGKILAIMSQACAAKSMNRLTARSSGLCNPLRAASIHGGGLTRPRVLRGKTVRNMILLGILIAALAAFPSPGDAKGGGGHGHGRGGTHGRSGGAARFSPGHGGHPSAGLRDDCLGPYQRGDGTLGPCRDRLASDGVRNCDKCVSPNANSDTEKPGTKPPRAGDQNRPK